MGDVLSFDPMSFVDCDNLKWIVTFDESILDIITEIKSIRYNDLVLKVNRSRKSIEDYLSKEDGDNMKAFHFE
jgi:hypothetical protein